MGEGPKKDGGGSGLYVQYLYNLHVDIEFDPVKDAENRRKHKGVSLAEGASVLLDPRMLVQEDPDSVDEQRLIGLGMSDIGRLLVVIWTMRGDTVRPISARKAEPKEAKNYA